MPAPKGPTSPRSRRKRLVHAFVAAAAPRRDFTWNRAPAVLLEFLPLDRGSRSRLRTGFRADEGEARRARRSHDLLLPDLGDKSVRSLHRGRRKDLQDLPSGQIRRRMPECPCPPADRLGAASRLPRLRACPAGKAGGYDVESDLSPGQEPLGGYPAADGRRATPSTRARSPESAHRPTSAPIPISPLAARRLVDRICRDRVGHPSARDRSTLRSWKPTRH